MKCGEGCLPTGMYAHDKECPGSNDEDHHCIDCEGLWCDDKGNRCERCGSYWCPDWQTTFYHSACSHLGDIYEADEECSIADDIETISDAGLCTQCILQSKLNCTVEDCKFNHKKILQRWIEFCERPIDIDLALLKRDSERVSIQAKLHRVRPGNIDCLGELWSLDMKNMVLLVNGVEDPIKYAWENLLKETQQIMKQKKTEGFIIKEKCFALRKQSRDKSPKRKK